MTAAVVSSGGVQWNKSDNEPALRDSTDFITQIITGKKLALRTDKGPIGD